MKLTFLGTGTSQGVPVIGCNCEVCRSKDQKDKRLRTSVLIESESTTIVIDTGPDFRQQMLREQVQKMDAVVFTHQHKDHVAGLDDIRAFNFKQQKDMPIFCNDLTANHLKQEFYYIFEPNPYPGVPKVNVHLIGQEPFQIGDIELIPLPVLHYKLPVLGFRMGDLAYITDANIIPPETKEKLKGLKVLVLNALRRKDHLSHFTLEQAIQLVEEIQPEKAYFTHISHLMGSHADTSVLLPEHVKLAWDGLKVEF